MSNKLQQKDAEDEQFYTRLQQSYQGSKALTRKATNRERTDKSSIFHR